MTILQVIAIAFAASLIMLLASLEVSRIRSIAADRLVADDSASNAKQLAEVEFNASNIAINANIKAKSEAASQAHSDALYAEIMAYEKPDHGFIFSGLN